MQNSLRHIPGRFFFFFFLTTNLTDVGRRVSAKIFKEHEKLAACYIMKEETSFLFGSRNGERNCRLGFMISCDETKHYMSFVCFRLATGRNA